MKKSDLEDDIAAISMQFHTAGLPNMSDALAQVEARRRGPRSNSRKTGKPVAKSGVDFEMSVTLGINTVLTIGFNGPPELDSQRAYELARLQIMAFFYFVTYDESKKIGHYWTGGFYPVYGAIKTDWGNPLHTSFIKQCQNLDYRLILNTANGYYRAMIRRHPLQDCWSWAVEWNNSYRLVGYFGSEEAAKVLFAELPPLYVNSIIEAPSTWIRHRVEQHLAEEDDTLFLAGDAE